MRKESLTLALSQRARGNALIELTAQFVSHPLPEGEGKHAHNYHIKQSYICGGSFRK